MVCYIVIDNFSVSFKISGRFYNGSQNTLKLIKEIEKYRILIESLIALFIEFSRDIAKFLFLQWKLGTKPYVHSILSFFDLLSL